MYYRSPSFSTTITSDPVITVTSNPATTVTLDPVAMVSSDTFAVVSSDPVISDSRESKYVFLLYIASFHYSRFIYINTQYYHSPNVLLYTNYTLPYILLSVIDLVVKQPLNPLHSFSVQEPMIPFQTSYQEVYH